MASNRKVMVLPGDGIGVEVMAANMKVIDWLAKHKSLNFDMSEGLVGGASYDAYGTPLTDETLADSVASDAVLFGAVGGPKYDALDFLLKPERGLLALRKDDAPHWRHRLAAHYESVCTGRITCTRL